MEPLSGTPEILINLFCYPIFALGPGRRVGVWLQGCTLRCEGCMSPHTWAFDPEYAVKADELVKRICDVWKHETPPPDGITFSGGEPFDQAEAFMYTLRELRKNGIRDILVYSGYRADLLISRHPELTDLITALVDGRYEEGLDCDAVWKGSANQSLTLFQPEFAARYSSWAAEKKGDLQLLKSDGRIIIAGIPHQGFSFELPTDGGDEDGSC